MSLSQFAIALSVIALICYLTALPRIKKYHQAVQESKANGQKAPKKPAMMFAGSIFMMFAAICFFILAFRELF